MAENKTQPKTKRSTFGRSCLFWRSTFL